MCGQGAGEWKLLATASSTTQQVATPWVRVGFLNAETKVMLNKMIVLFLLENII